MVNTKRANGQFFTVGNPFRHPAFYQWARQCGMPEVSILEPFAGANSLINHLQDMGVCNNFAAYDIRPSHASVLYQDTLAEFPSGYKVCVTNPPWLAKNSATVRGLDFPDCVYDDLYKFALKKCLDHCEWVAALVPESFIRANIFQSRLRYFVSLTSKLFTDTGHPVGLALFQPEPSRNVSVWSAHQYLGSLADLEALRPKPNPTDPAITFNDPTGNVGLIALDNTKTSSIRFCPVNELATYTVKKTGRHITKLRVNGSIRIQTWNEYLRLFREKTNDVLLTCYKGIRKDGKYRRRLDWGIARGIIHHA